jgi:hypothetical protein
MYDQSTQYKKLPEVCRDILSWKDAAKAARRDFRAVPLTAGETTLVAHLRVVLESRSIFSIDAFPSDDLPDADSTPDSILDTFYEAPEVCEVTAAIGAHVFFEITNSQGQKRTIQECDVAPRDPSIVMVRSYAVQLVDVINGIVELKSTTVDSEEVNLRQWCSHNNWRAVVHGLRRWDEVLTNSALQIADTAARPMIAISDQRRAIAGASDTIVPTTTELANIIHGPAPDREIADPDGERLVS